MTETPLDDIEIPLVTDTFQSDAPAASRNTFPLLYCSNFLSSWGDRAWEFGSSMIFTYMFTDTYLPGVLLAFFCQLTNFICGSYVGNWVSTTQNRLRVVKISLILQNTSVSICGIIQYYLFRFSGETVPWTNPGFILGFMLLLAIASIASVTSMARDIAINRDWVVCLARSHQTKLSAINATMRRINLICKFATPFFVSLLLELVGPKITVTVLSAWNIVSLIPEYIIIVKIYESSAELKIPNPEQSDKGKNPLKVIIDGWRLYMKQNVTLASVSYVLLYINGVTPGTLTSSYLKLQGINVIVIGGFQAIGAVSGLGSTFVAPRLIEKFGLPKTGMMSIWFQNAFNLGALVLFLLSYTCSDDSASCSSIFIYSFLTLIIISRLGLWSFDLVQVQVMQEYLDDASRGIVSGVEYSLTNLAYLVLLGLGTIFNQPHQYLYIVLISYSVLFIASSLYTFWFKRFSDVSSYAKVNEEGWDDNL